MEAKFFAEIQKNMDINTLKEFEKEVRGKIIDEFEILRNKNSDLSRVLMFGECLPKRRNFLDLLIFTRKLMISLILLKY